MIKSDAIGRIISGQLPLILSRLNSHQIRHLQAIRSCRTPALGGHIYICSHCHKTHKRYHSCRNRHCPQCQKTQKYQWIQAQEAKVLPCPYFHLVFTIPHQLNDLNLAFSRPLYSILFRAAWETLDSFGWNHKYLGAQLGATMILHTWGSNLSYHPHLHCIVPGGRVTIKGKWRQAETKGKYLFPAKAMSIVFRGKYIYYLKEFMEVSGMCLDSLQDQLYTHKWTVYAKRAPKTHHNLIHYLARYTHQIAISPKRISSFDNQSVTFRLYRLLPSESEKSNAAICMGICTTFCSAYFTPWLYYNSNIMEALALNGKKIFTLTYLHLSL